MRMRETVEGTLVGEKRRVQGAGRGASGGFARIASSIRGHHSQLSWPRPSEFRPGAATLARNSADQAVENHLIHFSRAVLPVRCSFMKGSTNGGSSKFEAGAPGRLRLRKLKHQERLR